jgi:lysophospholipase L1-like esterase
MIVGRRFDTGADSETSWPLTAQYRFPRLASGPDFIVALAMGLAMKIRVSRLPDAPQPWQGEFSGERPLSVLTVGDSTAAGCGVTDASDSLGARIAWHASESLGRGVSWRAIGQNGHRSDEFARDYLDEAASYPADIVYVSLGANDAMRMRSRRAAARDLVRIVSTLRSANPNAAIAVSCLPAFFRFTRLPEPLRFTLYRISQGIERTARLRLEKELGITMDAPPPPYPNNFFARDGFHPSAVGYDLWGKSVIDGLRDRGELERFRLR